MTLTQAQKDLINERIHIVGLCDFIESLEGTEKDKEYVTRLLKFYSTTNDTYTKIEKEVIEPLTNGAATTEPGKPTEPETEVESQDESREAAPVKARASRNKKPEAVETIAEPEAVETIAEPEAVETIAEPEAVETIAEPEAVETIAPEIDPVEPAAE